MNIFSSIATLLGQYEPKEANAVFIGIRELAHLRSSISLMTMVADDSDSSIELGNAKVCGLSVIPVNLKSHLSVGHICVSQQVISPQEQSPLDSVPVKSSSGMDAIYRTRLKPYSDALNQLELPPASDKSTSPEPRL